MGNLADHFRHLFTYEQASHTKVLAAMMAAPDEAKAAPTFQTAVDMMAHVMAARRMWLWRVGAAKTRPEGVFPKGVDLAALASETESVHQAWREYYERLDDVEIARQFDYTTLDGRPFSSTVEEILIQLHGHSMYHRGQISTWMREAGATPAPTDYVWWTQEQRKKS